MKRFLIPLAATLWTAGDAMAQTADRVLLFTTLDKEEKLGGCGGPALRVIEPQDVAGVLPRPQANYTAGVIVPNAAWHVLAGDADGDGAYGEQILSLKHDALLVRRPRERKDWSHPTARDIYFSPAQEVPSCVDTLNRPLRAADVGRLRPNGQWCYFLKQEHIASAFGIRDSEAKKLNVDAIAYKVHAEKKKHTVYFSLEETVTIVVRWPGPGLSSYVVKDGAILAIPTAAITGMDSCGVTGVVPNGGRVALTEGQVDAMVSNANVRGPSQNELHKVGDTDGLHPDPRGGFTRGRMGVIDNLLFSGDELQGCAVLSTSAGGSIAQLNGVSLASAAQTTGRQVGLRPTKGSLNGLEIIGKTRHFVIDARDRRIAGTETLDLELGGAGAVSVLFIGFGPNAACQISPALPMPGGLTTRGWPEFYPQAVFGFTLAMATPTGCGGIQIPHNAGLAGRTLVFQALSVYGPGDFAMSSPMIAYFE